jgi:hypothetical protein
MHRADKAAERKDFTAAHGKGEMVSALRQRRTRAPRIGYRVVFVVIRSCGPFTEPPIACSLLSTASAATSVRGAGNGIFRVQVPNVDCALANSAHTYVDTAMITHLVICCSVSLDRMTSSYIWYQGPRATQLSATTCLRSRHRRKPPIFPIFSRANWRPRVWRGGFVTRFLRVQICSVAYNRDMEKSISQLHSLPFWRRGARRNECAVRIREYSTKHYLVRYATLSAITPCSPTSISVTPVSPICGASRQNCRRKHWLPGVRSVRSTGLHVPLVLLKDVPWPNSTS